MIDPTVSRQLWHELHTKAGELKSNLAQKTFVTKWLQEAESMLGCATCWRKVNRFMALWPVAYGQELWLWSICLHDYVNKEMGRSLFYPHLTLAPLTQKGIIQ